MEITKFRAIDKGNLVGFASVKVKTWGFFVNDISIFCKNGFRWINFPSRMYEVEGVKKYAPYCGFDEKNFKEAFEKKFLAALDKYIIENPQEIATQETEKGKSKAVYTADDLPF